jgi:hypothetical protein
MEGFESGPIPGATDESSGVKWLNNQELYDDFYVSVYDQLTHGYLRNQS